MTPEQTPRQHAATKDRVIRSLLLAPTAEERSEERRYRRPLRAAPVVPIIAAVLPTRAYRLPIVQERRL